MARRRRRPQGPRFYIFAGEHLTVTPAPVERLIIGRHRRCHIRIPDDEIYKKHAVIERVGVADKWRVINFAEELPTLFDGEMMEKGESRVLEYGDVFEVGDYYFYFDRVRKDAPDEHREAFENLIAGEKENKKRKLLGSKVADEDDEEGEDDDEFVDDGQVTVDIDEDTADEDGAATGEQLPKIKGRRRRRRGLKSTARRRRSLRG